jgi:YVTN family beta-propeller protein
MRGCSACFTVLLSLLCVVAPDGRAADSNSFVNFETPVIHPVDLSPDGTMLAVCNLPSGRLELFDVTGGVPISAGSVPVGVDPVTARWENDNRIWVVNHISDSISIVSKITNSVVRTISTGDEPCDVVFAGEPVRAFVSCSQVDTVQVFSLANLSAPPSNVEILGEDPRALAVSPDKSFVYAAIFESGNGSTILGGNADLDENVITFPPNVVSDPEGPYGGVNPPPNKGLAFDPPLAPGLPPPPPVGLIVRKDESNHWMDDNGGDWTEFVSGAKADRSGRYPGWDVLDNDVAVIDASSLSISYVTRLMNIVMAIGVNPVSGDVTVVGTDGTNSVRFEPVINGRFLKVLAGTLTPSGGTIIDKSVVDLNPHLDYSTSTIAQPERNKSIGDPRGIVWNAEGTRGYVTGMGSNNIVVIDAQGNRVDSIPPVDTGEGPTGLAIDNARGRLYVLNRFAMSLSALDLESMGVVANLALFDPTPSAIKSGRKHLYSTHKNSGLGQIACASCHVDARMDRLAWDLGAPDGAVKSLDSLNLGMGFNGDLGFPALANSMFGPVNPAYTPFHPMKGPMTTQTFQDIIGHEPFHWRGDRLGLEEFNPAFVGLQGDDNLLTPVEMQQFEDFLAMVSIPPNPNRNIDNSLPDNLTLKHQYKSGRFGEEGLPLPNGNAVRGLEIYRRGVSVFDGLAPGSASPIDSGTFSCVFCHTVPMGTGTAYRVDFSAVDPNNPATYLNFTYQPLAPGPSGELHHMLVSVDGSTQKALKVPQLRNQFDKVGFEMTDGNVSRAGFGFLHDGSVDSVSRFVSEDTFDVTNYQETADLVALVLAFSGSEFPEQVPDADTPFLINPPGTPSNDVPAAVGKQTVIDGAKTDVNLVGLLMSLAEAGKIDLIAKGLDDTDTVRGFLYTTAGNFQSDCAEETTAYADLLASSGGTHSTTLTVVKRGTGNRLGIDRDEDGIYDFDETRDYDAALPGVQNPFNPEGPDTSGDDGQTGPDGKPDGQNDWDGDGADNTTELTQGRNPLQGNGADVDSSGDVNAIDVQLVINSALGIDIGGMDADVDTSGEVDAIDVQLVILAALGI